MDVEENRRAHLRQYADPGAKTGRLTQMALALGYSNATFLSGLLKKRPFTEKTARKIEKYLGVEQGSWDKPVQAGAAPAPLPDSGDLTERAVTAVALAAEREGVKLTPAKLAKLVGLVTDLARQTGSVDEATVRRMVQIAE